MAVTVDEYRYDSVLYVWRKIGEVNRDMQIAIASACTPNAQAGVQLDYQAPRDLSRSSQWSSYGRLQLFGFNGYFEI